MHLHHQSRANSDSSTGTDEKQMPGEQAKTKRVAWLSFIVGGQIMLVVIALSVLLAVRHKKQIPMGKQPVEFFESNPQVQTYTFTTVATALSMFSSFLFAEAVRHALIVALTRPLPISAIGFGVKLSKKSVILDPAYKNWFIASAFVFLLGLGQTPGWSSLLTPSRITVLVPIIANELDLNSTSTQAELANLTETVYQSINNFDIIPALMASGYASASAYVSQPGVIEFGNYTHALSTCGIVPLNLTLSDTSKLAEDSGLFNVVNTAAFPPSTSLADAFVVMEQQGIELDVSCAFSTFATLNPPISRVAKRVNDPDLPDSFLWGIRTACDSGQTIMTDDRNSTFYVFQQKCDHPAGPTFYMVVDGQGIYPGDFVCEMTTSIRVTLSNYTSGNSISTEFYNAPDVVPFPLGTMGALSLRSVQNTIAYGQSADSNIIGDTLVSISTQQGAFDTVDVNNPADMANFARIIESYMTGLVELSATVVKTRLAQELQRQGRLTPDKLRTSTGFAFVQTLGWEYKSRSSTLVLIPIFVFAAVTIAVALVAQWYNAGVPVSHAKFDAGDPWLLMSAAAAGGMQDVFHGVQKSQVRERVDEKVTLGRVEGRDGFVTVAAAEQ
ncbi:Protein arginine N-methyltransferase [Mycena indigotica]|uniref:Protein arginine N-methyltransferase n=1 Tax=Mycena indigotica TaxID=2126181 RepID=A0A8H6W0C7_9AGAR|nr:Protein arginine N-methyltransferase [Mycena indigotica]KAF7296943.1 Protein arginine N-methyltransferase [Mycena indigotica]